MKIGYLINTYPYPSSTFIRREICALEADGVEVVRYAIRRWSEPLVDGQDVSELARTQYLLTGSVPGLLLGLFVEFLANPRGMARAMKAWIMLVRNAGGEVVRHAAYLLEAISLKRRALNDGVRHLHVHFSTNSAAVGLLSKRLGGPSYSFTAHGPDEFVDWGRSSLAEKAAEAQFVVAISHFCRVQIARAAGMAVWDKVHVVRCGIDPTEFAESGTSFDANTTFVCVGRLCLQKAQLLIVEAVSRVVLRHPEVRVVMIGDGESRPAIEAAILRYGLQEHVILTGWRSNVEVRKILGGARALLLPSFAEGLPVVIMEALALGRPVITSFIAGIPELVDRGCGWIIPAGSTEDLVDAMNEALEASPSELVKKGREGRRRVTIAHDLKRNTTDLRGLLAREQGSPG